MRPLSVANRAAIFSISLIGSATAADMAVKAPPPVSAPPAYSWSGWYIGGNIGGGWADRDFAITPNDPSAVTFSAGFGQPAPNSLNMSGVVGGMQLGYNWQFRSNWLLGLETDFDWSGVKGSFSTTTAGLTGATAPWQIEERLKWFGTVRARVGWLPFDNLLVYGTGGFAYGQVEQSGSVGSPTGVFLVIATPPFSFACPGGGASCFSGSSRNTEIGWTAGGGIEWAAWQRWTLKAEYLYVSLDNKTLTETAVATQPGLPVPASFNVNFGRANFNIVRAGLNYKFN
jgi:outer membrane immunogenic protein